MKQSFPSNLSRKGEIKIADFCIPKGAFNNYVDMKKGVGVNRKSKERGWGLRLRDKEYTV